MKAIIYERYGGPEVLHIADIKKPKPKDNEILVKVHATSVPAATIWARTGSHPDSKFFTFVVRMGFGLTKPRKPIIGYELSGIVEEVGKNVTLFKKGDEVYGTTTGLPAGAYAEYVCLPEKWKKGVVAIKPKNSTFEEAACAPVTGMAALHILRKANIKKDQKVLIYGASGSMGSMAVQYAKHFGAEVTGVCSFRHIEMVRSLGATKIIDYTKDDFTKDGKIYDVVFDAVGKLPRSMRKKALKKTGTFLSSGSLTSETIEKMEYLKELIEAGKVKPYIDKVYTFEKTAEAHRYVDSGHKAGNVAIKVV
jgi:NADPH:quinone reductase-like Zn-dependent oxidoreductase